MLVSASSLAQVFSPAGRKQKGGGPGRVGWGGGGVVGGGCGGGGLWGGGLWGGGCGGLWVGVFGSVLRLTRRTKIKAAVYWVLQWAPRSLVLASLGLRLAMQATVWSSAMLLGQYTLRRGVHNKSG